MSEDDRNLLAVFDDCVHELIRLCDERKGRMEEMEASLKEKDEKIRQVEQALMTMKTNYENLLAARGLADDKEAFQQTRKRVNKLVREVDLCIALLNE
jgi:prefoldin subunit 5